MFLTSSLCLPLSTNSPQYTLPPAYSLLKSGPILRFSSCHRVVQWWFWGETREKVQLERSLRFAQKAGTFKFARDRGGLDQALGKTQPSASQNSVEGTSDPWCQGKYTKSLLAKNTSKTRAPGLVLLYLALWAHWAICVRVRGMWCVV